MRKPWQKLTQLTLDFFTGGDPQPVQAAPGSETVRPLPQPLSVATPAPAGFSHAAANRHAMLQGVTVSYRFERSRRKSIGFSVGPEGLVVRAPGWVPLREVDAAVQEKAAWILAKLQQMRERPPTRRGRRWPGRMAPTCLIWAARCACAWSSVARRPKRPRGCRCCP